MKLIETYVFDEPGYRKLFAFQEWRIAMLNYINDLEISEINHVECHQKTDEVFVLLEGECVMILYDHEKKSFHLKRLETNKAYNVPKGVYHNHVLTKGTKVFIVEQEDTNDDNSHRIYFEEEELLKLKDEWMKHGL